MSKRSKKRSLSWCDLTPFYGLSKRKRNLLTKEFLEDFKQEIINVFSKNDISHGKEPYDYSNETYMGLFGQLEGTSGFYTALRTTCKKYNLSKAIYEYLNNMPWYDSDLAEDNIVLEMVRKGVIAYEKDEDYQGIDDILTEDQIKVKRIYKRKGYNEVCYDTWFKNSIEEYKDIYKDDDCEIMFLEC